LVWPLKAQVATLLDRESRTLLKTITEFARPIDLTCDGL
jgi:hypothetical protein